MKGRGSLTSPSFRETSADRVTGKIGCIPGIFFFFHRHGHHRSRKLIISSSSAAKNDNGTDINADPPVQSSMANSSAVDKRVAMKRPAGSPDVSLSKGSDSRKISCDVPRSPTLSAEIRRSNAALVGRESTESESATPRRTPALVARLMGLDDLPGVISSPPSAVEKRRKLLGALDKCDEDLKALKRIIDTLRLTESRKLLVAGETEEAKDLPQGATFEKKRCSQPELSPVSVIDGLRSPTSPRPQRPPEAGRGRQVDEDTHNDEKLLKLGRKKNGSRRKPPTKPERRPDGLFRRTSEGAGRRSGAKDDEVWRHGLAEEMRRELGMVGVALEGGILRDLLEEVVEELRDGGGAAGRISSFDACRRRLRF